MEGGEVKEVESGREGSKGVEERRGEMRES